MQHPETSLLELDTLPNKLNQNEKNYKDIEESCGFEIICNKNQKRFAIPCLNYFATPSFALFFLCLAHVGHTLIGIGLISVVISTLEQRFHLKSSEAGIVASFYDIGLGTSALFVSYIGGKGHKPLWIGWGMFVSGVGSIIFSLPHFIAPPYTLDEEMQNTCNSTYLVKQCIPSHLRNFIYFFIVGQFLHGVGGSAMLYLGITYLDDNVTQVKSSLYHGAFLACGIVGPALGFLGGSQFLKIFTNINEKVSITDHNPLWIGAWWLGYIVIGTSVAFMAVPILLLPKYLPRTEHVRVGKDKEVFQTKRNRLLADNCSTSNGFSHLWKSFAVLCSNPLYVLVLIANALDCGLVNALSTFAPKYIGTMFRVTPTEAATYTGVVVISAGAAGHVLGGWVVSKMRWTVLGILRFCISISALSVVSVFVFAFTCPSLLFAGATVPYANESESSLSAYVHTVSCNQMCDCNTDAYEPVCGEDGITYYSPCLAGCRNVSDDFQTFSNCSCIKSGNGSALSGFCSTSDCSASLPLFLGFLFVYVLITFLPSTPTVQITLRIVPFEQRSFALGIASAVNTALGNVPVPVIFGLILDKVCAAWSSECGDTGACQLYDNTQLALHIGVLAASVKVLIVVFFGIAIFIYKPSARHSSSSHSDLRSEDHD